MSDDPIRVLWLIKGLGPGGAERLMVEAARHVDRSRFTYEACYLLPWKDHLAADLEAAGVPVRCLGVTRRWDTGWVRTLRRLITGGGFGVVHAHLPYAGIGARMAARRAEPRPAVVYTEHNTWDRYRRATRWLNRATFGLNDAVIAVSDGVARSMSRSRTGIATVIPNGVDAARLRLDARSRQEARRELGLDPDRPVVGTVGGLTAKKGHVMLVRAAREVVARHPEALFVLVGLPIDAGPVADEVARSGLADNVVLTGYLPHAARLMRAFDVYCLPSRFEGMPLSLLEAMSLGLPVVATAVGGVPEVVRDGDDGVLVPPDDPAALAGALGGLIDDPERRAAMGERAARSAGRFGVEAMVRRTEAVYLEALAARSGTGAST